MTILRYDGSFEGLLTAIFEVYEYRFSPALPAAEGEEIIQHLFAQEHQVVTDPEKAQRVLKKLEITLEISGITQLMKVYFSEAANAPELILYAVQQALLQTDKNILENYGDDRILAISKLVKSVNREIHRMHAFVRFEKMQDDVYFSRIEPDYNVLPLIIKHFRDRYRDQKWMIYDLKRQYGAFYDLEEVQMFEPTESTIIPTRKTAETLHESELQYQKLWQRYFLKTNIPERKNIKLHVQSLPKRYWKYLTEKW